MIRYFTFTLTALFLLASCATVEETADDDNGEEGQDEMELAETDLDVDEELLPDWYSVEKRGEVINGTLYGYARSLGSDRDWAYENALRQANSNLRIWIDQQVEVARASLAEDNGAADEREFIIQLRNAVTTLEFEQAEVESTDFEDNDGARHVVIKIELTSDDVLSELEEKLGAFSQVWNQMKEQEPLVDW